MQNVESNTPFLIHEEESFVIVWKPHDIHTAPLATGEPGTLLAWLIEKYPEIASVPGRKSVEQGLLHRLDRDTCGLVLCARTKAAFDSILSCRQFEKGYSAVCTRSKTPPPGLKELLPTPSVPGAIRSYFRPYGPGRKRVAAVPAGGRGVVGPYETRLLNMQPYASERDAVLVEVSLAKGFRHQVRVHLASIGFPIVGDALYGDMNRGNRQRLLLAATSLSFPHPLKDEIFQLRVPSPWQGSASAFH